MTRRSLFTFDFECQTTIAAAEHVLERRSFDVIVLDLTLPDSSGLDTLRRIKKKTNLEAILILTGQDQEDLGSQALQAGAQEYLIKGEIQGSVLSRAVEHSVERARLMREREDFITTLTHDLETPLGDSTKLVSDLIQKNYGPLSEEQSGLLGHIQTSNKTLLSLIDNLLDVYRFEKDMKTLRFEHTHLLKLITSCMSEIEPMARDKRIKLNQDLPETEEIILADSDSLTRVVRNLLDNAIKYTPNGGEVQVSLATSDEKIILSVSDSGPGIPKEDQKHLFERFWRGRASRRHTPGTGLGLYLCHQIISMHNGKIQYSDDGKHGSAFVIELPANQLCSATEHHI